MTKQKHRKHHNKKRIFTKIERYFYDWLYQNKDRFNHKPIQKETHMFYFEGITKQIYLAIDMRQMEAMLIIENKDGNIYDLYAIAYIGSLSYDSNKGYFDADRVDKVYAYYPSLKELLIAEIFEPIIKYCNEIFIRENYLYLHKYRGCTWHEIGSINKDIR